MLYRHRLAVTAAAAGGAPRRRMQQQQVADVGFELVLQLVFRLVFQLVFRLVFQLTVHVDEPVRPSRRVTTPSPCVLDPGVTATGIKIGVIAPLTGPEAASFSTRSPVSRRGSTKRTSRHELGRRRISLVVRDDSGDPIENLRQARELVERAKVLSSSR